jgi:hypothetical protein
MVSLLRTRPQSASDCQQRTPASQRTWHSIPSVLRPSASSNCSTERWRTVRQIELYTQGFTQVPATSTRPPSRRGTSRRIQPTNTRRTHTGSSGSGTSVRARAPRASSAHRAGPCPPILFRLVRVGVGDGARRGSHRPQPVWATRADEHDRRVEPASTAVKVTMPGQPPRTCITAHPADPSPDSGRPQPRAGMTTRRDRCGRSFCHASRAMHPQEITCTHQKAPLLLTARYGTPVEQQLNRCTNRTDDGRRCGVRASLPGFLKGNTFTPRTRWSAARSRAGARFE